MATTLDSLSAPAVHEGSAYASRASLASPAPGRYLRPHVDYPDTPQPALFKPLKLRGVEMGNRIVVSPMCTYSSEHRKGMPSNFHLAHLGAFAMRGPGLVFTEATAVQEHGMISPEDLGIWSDEHIEPFKRIVDLIHSHGTLAGIQLAHAGRKASTYAPWKRGASGGDGVPDEKGGWQVVGPSAVMFTEGYKIPSEMTLSEIATFKEAWRAGVERAIKAGFDVAEVHAAHGYLLMQFLSPLSNERKDQYGGCFENRIRLLMEVSEMTRSLWPQDKPVFVRISATEWDAEGEKVDGEWRSWGIEQSIELVKKLKELQIDLIDVSTGGNYVKQKITLGPGYQVPFAEQITKAVPDIYVSSVGLITNGQQANEVVESGKAQVVMLARELLRNADFVFDAAQDLHSVVQVPEQYARAYTRMFKE